MNRTGSRRVVHAALAAVLVCGLSAACAVADPDSSQAVLRYTGGPLNSQAFEGCLSPGTRDRTTYGHEHFYYPSGQRTFTFSNLAGADAPPLEVSTDNQIRLTVSGTITFRLNTDCTPYREYHTVNNARVLDRVWPGGLFQRFHDIIGRHSNAFASSGGDPQPPGWHNVMRLYVGGPITKAANDAGLHYSWQALYTDTHANAAWQQQVITDLPRLVIEQAGANHFIIDNVQLLQPTLPPVLNAALENKATLETDRTAAESFPGGIEGYQAYQRQLAMNEAIKTGKVRLLIVPQGSPVIASGG